MKKQILILMLFVLAAFANVTQSYGQVCAPSDITPAAGVEYTYSTTTAGTGAKYDWYITKNTDLILPAGIIAAPSPLFTVNATTPYHNAGTGTSSIKITWTAAAVADGGPFYLVLRYSETTSGSAGCTVENLKATEIKPINSFLLALQGGMLNAGSYVATAGSNTCAANVVSAVLSAGSPSTVLLTYDKNTLYYVATASGVIGDWYPQIQLPALLNTQVYVSADWTSDMTGAAGWATFGAVSDGATHDLLSATPATASVIGTPILIRIVVDNKTHQTLVDQTIQLGLDGFLPPTPIAVATSKSDVTSATDCTPLGAFGRKADFIINKRPNPTGTPAFLGVTNP